MNLRQRTKTNKDLLYFNYFRIVAVSLFFPSSKTDLTTKNPFWTTMFLSLYCYTKQDTAFSKLSYHSTALTKYFALDL